VQRGRDARESGDHAPHLRKDVVPLHAVLSAHAATVFFSQAFEAADTLACACLCVSVRRQALRASRDAPNVFTPPATMHTN